MNTVSRTVFFKTTSRIILFGGLALAVLGNPLVACAFEPKQRAHSPSRPAGLQGLQFDAYLYAGGNEQEPRNRFSPEDTIVVRLILKHLPEGDYTFHADWYNASGAFQDTSRYRFCIPKQRTEILESRLELIKASPLRRAFSASESTGYHIKFYGTWRVKLYLNGEELVEKPFEVR